MIRLLLSFLIASICVACTPSTEIVQSWKKPNVSVKAGSLENKALVIAFVKDESTRWVVEDQLKKRLNANAVASYTILTPDHLKEGNDELLKSKLKEGKFTNLLIMRLGSIEKETTYVPGTTTSAGYYGGYPGYYGGHYGYGGYYGYGASSYTTPGYYTTDKNYFIETVVYSVEPDEIIWRGTTKSVNPSKVERTVNEIADAVSRKMRADGFLK